MIDIGTALQVAQLIAYVVGIVVFIVMIKADIKIIQSEMSSIQKRADNHAEKLNILTDAFAKLAVQDNRLKNVEEDVRELKHGKGFITDDAGLIVRKS